MIPLMRQRAGRLLRVGWMRRRLRRGVIGLVWLPLLAVGLGMHSLRGSPRLPPVAMREERRERAHVVTTGRVPDGPPFAIVYECKTGSPEGTCYLTAVLTGPRKPAFLSNNSVTFEIRPHHLRTMEAGVTQTCAGPRKITWVLGVLQAPADRAVVREEDGRMVALQRVAIPHDRLVGGVVLYGVMRTLPRAVIARAPDGRVVFDNGKEHAWWASEKLSCPSKVNISIGTIE